MMASPSDRFKQLAERWFLTEPAFFAIYCSHALTMNPRINCYMRIGKGRLEYIIQDGCASCQTRRLKK